MAADAIGMGPRCAASPVELALDIFRGVFQILGLSGILRSPMSTASVRTSRCNPPSRLDSASVKGGSGPSALWPNIRSIHHQEATRIPP
jgi:hypothetical protein